MICVIQVSDTKGTYFYKSSIGERIFYVVVIHLGIDFGGPAAFVPQQLLDAFAFQGSRIKDQGNVQGF